MFKTLFHKILITFLFLIIGSTISNSTEYKKKHSHGHGHEKHDEINMPGLQGIDTTTDEVSDLKKIFQNHKDIKRKVTNLDNGIKTET